MTDSYEQVAYPGCPYPQTHPDRLATIATLFGMSPAPVDNCRVLEIGCGDGANLIPMAVSLPHSRFIGIDSAAAPIHRGRRLAEQLGLGNLSLERRDVREITPEWGRFDYAIVHGLYAWVPPEVRERILAVAAANLAPGGVAFVSYNVFPGAHARIMMREMLRFHLRRMDDTAEQLTEMRAFLKLLSQAAPEEGPHDRVRFMQAEALRLLERTPEVVYHDELAETYAPVYFHEFASQAARHGLQYLGEAFYSDMHGRAVPAAALAALNRIPDRILREQYLDFLKCRAFRQTLLCHEAIALDAEPKPEAVAACFFASETRPVSDAPDVAPGAVEEFRNPRGVSAKTAHPVVKALLVELSKAWPRAISFPELRERLGVESSGALAEALLKAYAADLVEAHVYAAELAAHAGERPAVHPLTRFELERGNVVTSVRHTRVDVDGELERKLVLLLDGTRDRAALIAELSALAGRAVAAEELERTLETLARLGLLIG